MGYMQKDEIHAQPVLPCLKTLALEVKYTAKGYIDRFMQLLMMCPCLETLYINVIN